MSGDDCIVIRVDDTLFRVHRFLLGRDNSAFEDMLSLPCGRGKEAEGFTDSNPITLFGESPKNFRVLLSVLYALPMDLQVYSSPIPPIPRLLTVIFMTNKYHFTTTCAWALDTLYNFFAKQPSPWDGNDDTMRLWDSNYHLLRCPPYLLVRLMEIAMVCDHEGLKNLAKERWMEVLWRSHPRLNLTPQGENNLRWAINAAERWGMKELAGIAYYILLIVRAQRSTHLLIEDDITEGPVNSAPDGDDPPPRTCAIDEEEDLDRPPPRLTAAQGVRLLCGHYSLVRYLEALQRPPSFPKPDGCTYHQQGCIYSLGIAWSRIRQTHVSSPSADVVSRLEFAEGQLRRNQILDDAMTPACKNACLSALKSLIASFRDGTELVKHFELEEYGFAQNEVGAVLMKDVRDS